MLGEMLFSLSVWFSYLVPLRETLAPFLTAFHVLGEISWCHVRLSTFVEHTCEITTWESELRMESLLIFHTCPGTNSCNRRTAFSNVVSGPTNLDAARAWDKMAKSRPRKGA